MLDRKCNSDREDKCTDIWYESLVVSFNFEDLIRR
jgi:hypothetical protein